MSQLKITPDQIQEAREEARSSSPGVIALQHTLADRELRKLPSQVKAFLREILPEISTKRVCTVLGTENLDIPYEIGNTLNPDERLALYLAKGQLSWMPSALERFQNMYRGVPEDLILEVRNYADRGLLEGQLGNFPKGGSYRVMPLEVRLQGTPRLARIGFERDFFTRIENSYAKYNALARLKGDKLIERIYEAVTSSSQR